MGRVFLDAYNKLVVETDNGVINPDGTASAEITSKETYTISVGDIAALLKIVNSQDTLHEDRQNKYGMYFPHESKGYDRIVHLITDADIKKELEDKEKTIENLKRELEGISRSLDRPTNDTKDLRKDVDDFVRKYHTLEMEYDILKQKVEENNATSHFFRHNINIEVR